MSDLQNSEIISHLYMCDQLLCMLYNVTRTELKVTFPLSYQMQEVVFCHVNPCSQLFLYFIVETNPMTRHSVQIS